jgi:hypothetical protein
MPSVPPSIPPSVPHHWTVEEAWALAARCREGLPPRESERPKLTIIQGGKKS